MADNKKSTVLFNEGGQNQNLLIEQYKSYVETANHTSGLRNQSNTFFLTINTLLIGFISGLLEFFSIKPTQYWLWIACIAGILLTINWYVTINAYRSLNSGRFYVIQELETRLPARIYAKEWEIITERRRNKYIRLTNIEQYIPIGFGLIYVLILITYYL